MLNPSVSIILINWNGIKETRECLDSLSKISYQPISITIVDNGSSEKEAEALQVEFPAVRVLETGRNLGFTGANNVGIRYALTTQADYIICLNNDTIVAPNFLEPLVEAMEIDKDAGIVTGAVYYYSEPNLLSSLGCWVDLSQGTPVGHMKNNPVEAMTASSFTGCGTFQVPAVDGCLLMMRRCVAEKTQGYDESFFAYVEDTDLCLRTRAAGWKCLAVPASKIWHKIGTTTGGENSPTSTHYYTRNCCRLLKKHGSPIQKKLFYRRFRENWTSALAEYIRNHDNYTSWHDEVGLRKLTQVGVDVYVGLAGLGGPRSNYRWIEAILFNAVRLRVAAAYYEAFYLLPIYQKLYWKLNALAPVLVTPLPVPVPWWSLEKRNFSHQRIG